MTGANMWCGYFGPGNTRIRDMGLRDAIAQMVMFERLKWFNMAQTNALTEGGGAQFQHLVRYSLARHSSIRPTTLAVAQTQAALPALNSRYSQLFANPSPANVTQVREDLLAGAPNTGTPSNPSNLEVLVESDIRLALDFRNDVSAWSSVFVVFCVRATAIQEGLEAEFDGQHLGRDGLLLGGGSAGHRGYLIEAYNRKRALTLGTYHAFPATERAVQKGDIIVLDRQRNINIADVTRYTQIPTLGSGRALHGDIVVEVVPGDHVITIGGNLGEIPGVNASEGVRRRRYPINTEDRLVVAEAQEFAQEDSGGNLPNIPAPGAMGGTLRQQSTGRIFALLSLVEKCAAVEAPEAGWLIPALDLILS
ncbi:hypothetical protein ACWF9G_22850 [Nocardia sp. NPDC055029]